MMRLNVFLLLGLNAFSAEASISANASIVINEIAYTGASINTEDSCNGADWVEFYNKGFESVNLTGFILHDDNGKDEVSSHTFSDVSMEAGDYLVLCKDEAFGFNVGAADTLTLLDADGESISSVQLEGRVTANVTYAMFDTFKYTAEPTPGRDNNFSMPPALDVSDLFVESIDCGAGISACANTGNCFSHSGDVCQVDGSVASDSCLISQRLCQRCFPYSRCGGGLVLDDNSGVFALGQNCGAGLELCANTDYCFDHSEGFCQNDGSMGSDECKSVQTLCTRCYPDSRCGGATPSTAGIFSTSASESSGATTMVSSRVLAMIMAGLWMAL